MLTVDKLENKYIVSFSNISKLNVLNSKEVQQQLMPLLTQGKTNLTINLNGIKFIDSSGFQMLMELYRTAKINASSLDVMNVSEELGEIIKLVQLDQVFLLN